MTRGLGGNIYYHRAAFLSYVQDNVFIPHGDGLRFYTEFKPMVETVLDEYEKKRKNRAHKPDTLPDFVAKRLCDDGQAEYCRMLLSAFSLDEKVKKRIKKMRPVKPSSGA